VISRKEIEWEALKKGIEEAPHEIPPEQNRNRHRRGKYKGKGKGVVKSTTIFRQGKTETSNKKQSKVLKARLKYLH